MYHVELRQFPHNACRFNLDAQQLQAVLQPWASNQVVELGERKWMPQLAKLTVLEGPHMEPAQLSMGRGWRNAQRASQDVTEQVLAALAQSGTGESRARDAVALAAADLAHLLGPDAPALLAAWQAVIARSSGLTPSESLALAERATRR